MRILVVEDEPKLLRGLVSTLERAEPSWLISACLNAPAAEQLLSEQDYDLLITDINLPLKSGLELIAWTEERGLALKYLILSGYSDFSYAQQALRFGVVDYLLKPVADEKLLEAVRRVADALRDARYRRQKAWLMQNYGYLRAEQAEPVQDALPFGGSGEEGCCYYWILAARGALPYSLSEAEAQRARAIAATGLEEELERLRAEGESLWVFPNVNGTLSCLLALPRAAAALRFARRLEELERWLEERPELTLLTSAPIAQIDGLRRSHEALLETLAAQAALHGRGLLRAERGAGAELAPGEEKPAPGETEPGASRAACAELWKHFAARDFAAFTAGWAELLDGWRGRGLLQRALEQELLRFASAAMAQPGNADYGEDALLLLFPALRNELGASDGWAQFEAQSLLVLRSFVGEHLKNEGQQRPSKREALARRVRDFIDTHYDRPLNLQTLAANFAYSGSYLSSLFASRYALSPLDYLLALRIEKAKALLAEDPEATVQEIAGRVGYSDPLYFSKQFKKAVGRSPSEFRSGR